MTIFIYNNKKYYNMGNILKDLQMLTPSQEEMQNAHVSYMKYLRENINNFSYWFPRIEVVGKHGINVPKSYIIDVPEDIYEAFFQERKGDQRLIRQWAHKAVLPVIKKHFDGKEVFMKNGCYSGKFSFDKCCHIKANASLEDIVEHLCELQMDSMIKETDGNLEVVLREWIQPEEDCKTIYGGMPLRTEMRLFYDFSNHKPLYWVNYWNWDECHDPICIGWNGERKVDADAYEQSYKHIDEKLKQCQQTHWQTIINALQQVASMEGIWSVDFLFESNQVWLIDAAVGPRSFYWDNKKVKEAMEA